MSYIGDVNVSIENKENSSEERKQRVERIYQELHNKISKLCDEADEELAKIQRQEWEHYDEPA